MSDAPNRAGPGWHGKLPTLGDFATRGLPAHFLQAWDPWLAEGLSQLQARHGTAWLQAYLDSPSWRFVLAPDVLDAQAWAGVLMPSVDRVGRYFPLTLAQPLPGLPRAPAACQALSAWLDRLDEIAVNALYDDWGIAQLEQALAGAPPPALANANAPWPSDGGDLALGSGDADGMGGLLAGQGLALLARQMRGMAWWLGSHRDGPPRALVTRGLPRGDDFGRLLNGA